MRLKRRPVWLMAATLAVPLQDDGKWVIQKYSNIKVNEVSFLSPAGISIKVDKSASPLVRLLPENTKISGFSVEGKLNGLPKFAHLDKEGSGEADDFALRIGFVVPGDKKLGALRKLFAPEWIRNLFSMAPEGKGIDRIWFFNFVQNLNALGKGRVHPKSELIREEYFAHAVVGPFSLKKTFDKPIDAAAVWINSDGDDSGSSFGLEILKLELGLEEDKKEVLK